MSKEINYESMFNEIERLSDVFHSIKIKDNDLIKILEDKQMVCMCGGLIFTKLLPDDIAKKYIEWSEKKFFKKLNEKNVAELTKEINENIIKRIQNDCKGEV